MYVGFRCRRKILTNQTVLCDKVSQALIPRRARRTACSSAPSFFQLPDPTHKYPIVDLNRDSWIVAASCATMDFLQVHLHTTPIASLAVDCSLTNRCLAPRAVPGPPAVPVEEADHWL